MGLDEMDSGEIEALCDQVKAVLADNDETLSLFVLSAVMLAITGCDASKCHAFLAMMAMGVEGTVSDLSGGNDE